MIPTAIKTDVPATSTQIKPVTAVSPVTAIADSQTPVADFIEGQKYTALIEARLLNGNSRVLVDGKPLQMKLPDNFLPGNKMELVFVANKPEPQFLILNQAQNDSRNNTSISTTGKMLGFLMQETFKPNTATANALGQHHTSPSTPISSKPISSNSSINSTELPGLLQKAISQSGLFYESHQAQWIQGENTLEKLQQEPQGKLPMLTTSETTAPRTITTTAVSPDTSIHSQAIPYVQQQLTTLETGHLFWRGEIWQGQIMDWDIHEDPKQGEKENSPADLAQQWHTQIRLSMPQLGDITASIALNAQGINIKLNALQPATSELLESNQAPLALSLHSAGITIRALEIEHNVNK